MVLSSEEARVLASLMEAEAIAPDRYPLTLNTLRLACNQAAGRDPVVAYDDRTVETALLALTSKGLVRSPPSDDGGARYRHTAGERWRLGGDEVAVLAALVLGGTQTASGLRQRLERHFLGNRPIRVDEILDTLAARSPEALAARQPPGTGDGEPRWVHRLSDPPPTDETGTAAAMPPTTAAPVADEIDRLQAQVSDLRGRVAHIEKLIGLAFADDDDEGEGEGTQSPR